MSTGPAQKIGLSLDPAALNALKNQSRDAPEAALRSVAKQFEAVFLNMMLKSMRETVPTDGALDSEQSRMFTGMLDEQYAGNLTQGRGLGLADMIVRQLSPAAHSKLPATDSGGPTVDQGSQLLPAAPGLPKDSVAAPAAGRQPSRRAAALPPGAVDAFKDDMGAHAQAASVTSGIPAEFLIAQAGLESGWGQHQPLTAGGQPSHNLFGIKAGPHWQGKVAQAETTEVIDGQPQRVSQRFRAYDSYAQAFQDYAALLSGSARYARAINAGGAEGFAGALQKAGYATDPEYAAKVARAIRQVGDLRA
jgi:flagellar protein FlgJ